jgi:hypothetical protein
VAVAWRAVDDDAGILKLLAGGVNVVHFIGEMAEIASARIGFLVPVIGQFQRWRVSSRPNLFT